MNRLKKTFGLLLLALVSTSQIFAAVNIGHLRCENLENPQNIDTANPQLSWRLSFWDRHVKQTAYQILVASTADGLKSGTGDLWDSGKVVANGSVPVIYAGQPPATNARCFWKVRIWDAGDIASAWSKPAVWTEGVPGTNVLSGTSWIWYPEGEPLVAAPLGTNYFRRVVTLPAGREIKRATFEYTGDNQCRGWLGKSDLGASNYKNIQWTDVTARIKRGQTCVLGLTGINSGPDPKVAGITGKFTVEFTTGEPLVIRTDVRWKTSKHPASGWHTAGFDDSRWETAVILGPAGMWPWGKLIESHRQP